MTHLEPVSRYEVEAEVQHVAQLCAGIRLHLTLQ